MCLLLSLIMVVHGTSFFLMVIVSTPKNHIYCGIYMGKITLVIMKLNYETTIFSPSVEDPVSIKLQTDCQR